MPANRPDDHARNQSRVERPQPERFSDLQQPEWRGAVACNIDREGIGEPPLEEGDRYFDGFGCRDDLGDQGICLSLGLEVRDWPSPI
jgi:hypothetical protein